MATTRQRLNTDVRRAQILKAGLRVFGRQAYAQVSVGTIAEQAGISAGLLYHYFPSKKALFVAAYEWLAGRFVDSLAAQHGHSPWAAIESSLDAYLKHAQQHPKAVLMLLRPSLAGDKTLTALNESINRRVCDLIRMALHLDGDDAALMLALRAWVALVDRAVLDWLSTKAVERDEVKALALRTLRSALNSSSVKGTSA